MIALGAKSPNSFSANKRNKSPTGEIYYIKDRPVCVKEYIAIKSCGMEQLSMNRSVKVKPKYYNDVA